ncbi:MAG: serine/threonine protein kinase [Candidatus Brocadiaceae bacterium]|nr:serine/threonine protein kinase [Candidatus Brocadiaceae bacterium]
MTDAMPEKFGKCKIVKELGHGATAYVYLARHEVLDMPVAVKVLRRGLSERKPHYAERFLREAKMAAWLDHPNIVRVIDCGVEHGHHYMVMDYVDGPNCLRLLGDRPSGMEWREAVEVALQVADALAYAVSRDVIHRDVKPSNIMIDSTGRARVTDLGLAKLTIKGMAALTQELHTVGTPNYMSPEQIKSSSDLDLRADIYSLGASLYHMVCGSPPFNGKTAMEVVAMHVGAPLEPPFRRRPGLPRSLSSVICKMMAKAPGDRYQDYASLTGDLRNLLAGKETSAADFHETALPVRDDELRDILDQLQFSAGLDIETEEQAPHEDGAEVGQERDALGSSDISPFGPEDYSAYVPPPEESSASTLLQQARDRRRELIIGLIIAGAFVVIVAIILLVAIGGR